MKDKMRLASYNTAYAAHFVRPNFGFAETSYMLGTLKMKMIKTHNNRLSLNVLSTTNLSLSW
ncbi:MAG: hypothetical protein KAU17_16030, partial [Spirochaetales bacterium]|nr:hypothetical protein [Spirochaetales bacterium]